MIRAVFLAFFLLVSSNLAAIHEYVDVELPNNAFMYRRSGMYGPEDTPQDVGEPSFIKIDLTVEREKPEYHGEDIIFELVVFDQEVWDNGFGIMMKDKNGLEERFYCCTEELARNGLCDQPLTLIIKEDIPGTYLIQTKFEADPDDNTKTVPKRIDQKFSIPKKGLKFVLFSTCNPLAGAIKINGKTEWHNPYGYLPGELFGFLHFFSGLAVLYLIIGALWAIGCACYWKQLMILQNYVTVVLALGMMEMALRYYDFAQFNRYGTRGVGLTLASSVLHTVKQTVSRLLVLVVSMGFGIVKPTLGDSMNTIVGLGALFFFFAVVQRVYELSSHTSAITFMQYVTMLPVAALDLVFFFWIFRSLNDVIAQLEAREQGIKLALYKQFRIVLVFTMIIATVWSLAYSFIVVSGRISSDWESRWMFDGFFDVLYVLVLVAIMILWRPTNNTAQFAYQKVTTHDVDDDEEDGMGLAEEQDEVEASPLKPAKASVVTPENGEAPAPIEEKKPKPIVKKKNKD